MYDLPRGEGGRPASVRVRFAVRKRGGRKLVITPDGRIECPRSPVDSALVKALARAHRWQRILESGDCGSITELAAADKIDRSYLCRVLRLTTTSAALLTHLALASGRRYRRRSTKGPRNVKRILASVHR